MNCVPIFFMITIFIGTSLRRNSNPGKTNNDILLFYAEGNTIDRITIIVHMSWMKEITYHTQKNRSPGSKNGPCNIVNITILHGPFFYYKFDY